MKKIFLSALCALGFWTMSTNANAQSVADIKAPLLADIEGMPPYKLGVTVGFNSSNFSVTGTDPKAGFNFGADLMLDASDLIQNTYVRLNLLIQRKGARYEWGDIIGNYSPEDGSHREFYGETKVRTWHLEIPMAYGYAYRLDKDWTLLGEMGPYFSLGLGGNYKYEGSLSNSSMKFYGNDIKYAGKTIVESPKRFDIGWGFAVGGMLWSQHQVKVGYQVGFINMNDAYQQNRNFMINYTYFFE